MFDFFNAPYYLIIALQAICVVHCLRKGNQGKWIWIIVILPVIGCLIYLFSEVITKRDLNSVQSNISTIINPVGRIKDLEKKLEFSPTFDNKVALADACLAGGQTERAIDLYESCLTGIFDDNEYVVNKLITAYYELGRYEDVIRITAKIYRSSEFKKSHGHILYALSLENTGKIEQAETELKTMRGKFSNFEGRVNYGRFLVRRNRNEEAKAIFSEILEEASYMKTNESRGSREWFRQAREDLAKIS
ncbi:MAG: PLDc N-terminal domain-containing protein [Bacteroidia bacterium]